MCTEMLVCIFTVHFLSTRTGESAKTETTLKRHFRDRVALVRLIPTVSPKADVYMDACTGASGQMKIGTSPMLHNVLCMCNTAVVSVDMKESVIFE